VGRAPCRPRSRASCSRLQLYSHSNAWANWHTLGGGQPNHEPNTVLACSVATAPALAEGSLDAVQATVAMLCTTEGAGLAAPELAELQRWVRPPLYSCLHSVYTQRCT
jgi:hypothetical protein